MTILLAVRSRTIADGIANRLREVTGCNTEGSDIIHVQAAKQALERLRTRDIDLFVIGWRLKESAGVMIVRELRKRPAWETLPILMVSPHADRKRVMRAVMVGVDGYLLRPFERRALGARVKQAMVRRRLLSERPVSEEIEA